MFDNEIVINEFQLDQFQKIASDIPDEVLFQPAAGHGHPPAWIMGHMAISGELGQRILGGSVAHPEWLRLFGPGSSDRIEQTDLLTKPVLVSAVIAAYEGLRSKAATADVEITSRPHRFTPLVGSPLKTNGHLLTQLLTNHFGFHLSQLSSCRRTAGHAALF